jgi:hypothetical protein
MDKLSLARAVISKEKQSHIIERIKRKDGSVSARTFVREAFEIDRLKTALHEAAHVVVGFLLGRRLGPEGVRLNNPRRGEYARGGYCRFPDSTAWTCSELVTLLQAGRLAEAFTDKGVKPVSAGEAADAPSMINTTIAMATLWRQNLSDLDQALVTLKSARPEWSQDQIVSSYVEHQDGTEKFIRQPQVASWIWNLALDLGYAEAGILSDAEAWDSVGQYMAPWIEALRKSASATAPVAP